MGLNLSEDLFFFLCSPPNFGQKIGLILGGGSFNSDLCSSQIFWIFCPPFLKSCVRYWFQLHWFTQRVSEFWHFHYRFESSSFPKILDTWKTRPRLLIFHFTMSLSYTGEPIFVEHWGGDNLQFYPNFALFSTLGWMNLDHDFFQVSKLSEEQKKRSSPKMKHFFPRIQVETCAQMHTRVKLLERMQM